MPTADEPIDLVRDGWRHVQLQRPIAAWASWQRALRAAPGHPAAAEALSVLAAADDLPAAARAVYRFRSPRGEEPRVRWDEVMRGRDLADLGDAATAFAEIADAGPEDADALYNLALCLAWSGDNGRAIVALDASVSIEAEPRFEAAAASWLLAEVLRLGAGAEELADDFDFAFVVDWPDGDPAQLDPPGHLRPLLIEGEDPAHPRAYEWLGGAMPEAEEVRSADDLPLVIASIVRSPGKLRVSTPDPAGPLRAEAAVIRKYPDRAIARESRPLTLRLADADAWRVRLPVGLEPETRRRLAREAIEVYYESTWIDYPRLGLDGLSPLEASRGGPALRSKVAAVIAFREQLAARPMVAPMAAGYPFDRIRRRLGLPLRDESMLTEVDPTSMGLDELRKLDPSKLDPSRRAEAVASSLALGDPENARRFETDP